MTANCWRQIEMLNENTQSFLLAIRWGKLQKCVNDAILISEIHERVEKSELTIFLYLEHSWFTCKNLSLITTTCLRKSPLNPTCHHSHPPASTCHNIPTPALTCHNSPYRSPLATTCTCQPSLSSSAVTRPHLPPIANTHLHIPQLAPHLLPLAIICHYFPPPATTFPNL